MSFQVYQISFSDGTAYIGVTEQEVAERIAQHAKGSNNVGVRARMNRGSNYQVEILDSVRREPNARSIERRRIREARKKLGDKLLNET